MVMTPEGRVKAAVKTILDPLRDARELWYDMPVPGGWGKSSLDFVGCHRGRFFAVETKAPGKSLTPRQELCRDQMREAGGKVFEIDGPEGLEELRAWLKS